MTASNSENMVFLGVHGTVFALDRGTGQELWQVHLKGGDYVNLALDRDRVLASTKGEVFCLDATTGQLLWANKLPGMGLGLVTMVTAASPGSPIAPEYSYRKRDQETSAATTAAIVAST